MLCRCTILGWQLQSLRDLKILHFFSSFLISIELSSASFILCFIESNVSCFLQGLFDFFPLVFGFHHLFYNVVKRGCLWIYPVCALLCSLHLWIDIFSFLLQTSIYRIFLKPWSMLFILFHCCSFLTLHVSMFHFVYFLYLCLILIIQCPSVSNMSKHIR